MFTDHEEQVLDAAVDQGGVTLSEVVGDIYQGKGQANEALNRLADGGLLRKCEAPADISAEYVYVPTEAAQLLRKS